MQFNYSDDTPSISAAVTQAVGFGSVCWTNLADAGAFQSGVAAGACDAAVQEIRDIVTTQLATLFDREGQAREWNAAIEQAISTVEGLS